MSKFLNLRKRALQSLLLGLVLLTFYTYYRSTVNGEIRPYVATARTGNRSAMLESIIQSTNVTGEVQSSKNSSLEINSQPTLNNPTSIAALPSSSIVSQLSSSSASLIPTNLQNTANDTTSTQRSGESSAKETIGHSGKLNETTTSNTTPTVSSTGTSAWGDTARAIYQFGHDVNASEKCPKNGREMDLVITIMSAPSHLEARTAIRQTWGHYGERRDVGILFMLGKTRDPKMERLLQQEERLYGDVVRGRYIDSYANLTLKTISSLEWVIDYCKNAKFMLKTDDDMFINAARLLSFVRKHAHDENVIFGRLAKKWKPIRNKKSKYYVSTAQFKPPVFPDFTTGPAYLLSHDVIKKIYLAALDQTYLKLEDVFTTGIVAHQLGIKRSHAVEFLNKRIPHNPCNVQRAISIHMVKYSEQFDLWKKLLDGKSKCK